MGQGHFNFEIDPLLSRELCPGAGWEQIPEGRWSCSTDRAIEGNFSLKHVYDNIESDCDYLIYSHPQIDPKDSLILSFRIRHGYTPSSANNWQLALAAEFSKEEGQIQTGMVVGVNFMGSDDRVKIWNVMDGKPQEICKTSLNYQEEIGISEAPLFALVWHPKGNLILYVSNNSGQRVQIGACELEKLPLGQEVVLRYAYTSARDQNLWLDEFFLGGSFFRDTLPPVVEELEVLGEHSLQVNFSERIESAQLASFLLNGQQADSFSLEGSQISLIFPTSIPNRIPQSLAISHVCDRVHNCLTDTLLRFQRNEPVWGDVVFNEVMADPDPLVLLEGEEYLELYNRSEHPIDLSRWSLHVNHRRYDQLECFEWNPSGLTLSDPQIKASHYKVIKGIALPNDGATLALYSKEGVLVHGASYQVPWDGADWKKEGGWSLESPDPDQLCLLSQWWTYSADPMGGTPGRINSHFSRREDRDVPHLLYYGYESGETMVLTYSEALAQSHLNPHQFILKPGTLFPTEVEVRKPLSRQLVLKFPQSLLERQQFKLEIPAVSDCAGNLSQKGLVNGGSIRPPVQGDLFINEIMFHPRDGDPEFVELYNPGPGYFDLRYLSLHVVEPGDAPHRPFALSESSRIFLPGEYLVLCVCVPHLLEAYGLEPSGRWLEVTALPGLKNAGGTLYLTDRSGGLVDQVNYSETQHMDLLVEPKGVSLERISVHRPGIESANWHSAASIVGHATPGEANSQAENLPHQDKLLFVEPAVFSPDNDGFQDQLKIGISPKSKGWVIRLWISNLSGSPVRSLANNHMAGPSVSYSWDGETDRGQMAPEGIYVVHLLAYHPESGKRRSSKMAIGVLYR